MKPTAPYNFHSMQNFQIIDNRNKKAVLCISCWGTQNPRDSRTPGYIRKTLGYLNRCNNASETTEKKKKNNAEKQNIKLIKFFIKKKGLIHFLKFIKCGSVSYISRWFVPEWQSDSVSSNNKGASACVGSKCTVVRTETVGRFRFDCNKFTDVGKRKSMNRFEGEIRLTTGSQ